MLHSGQKWFTSMEIENKNDKCCTVGRIGSHPWKQKKNIFIVGLWADMNHLQKQKNDYTLHCEQKQIKNYRKKCSISLKTDENTLPAVLQAAMVHGPRKQTTKMLLQSVHHIPLLSLLNFRTKFENFVIKILCIQDIRLIFP